MIETEGLTRSYDTEADRIARLCHKAQDRTDELVALCAILIVVVTSLVLAAYGVLR